MFFVKLLLYNLHVLYTTCSVISKHGEYSQFTRNVFSVSIIFYCFYIETPRKKQNLAKKEK